MSPYTMKFFKYSDDTLSNKLENDLLISSYGRVLFCIMYSLFDAVYTIYLITFSYNFPYSAFNVSTCLPAIFLLIE